MGDMPPRGKESSRRHLQSIYGKLGVRSQEELIEKLRSELGNPRLSEEGSPRQLDS